LVLPFATINTIGEKCRFALENFLPLITLTIITYYHAVVHAEREAVHDVGIWSRRVRPSGPVEQNRAAVPCRIQMSAQRRAERRVPVDRGRQTLPYLRTPHCAAYGILLGVFTGHRRRSGVHMRRRLRVYGRTRTWHVASLVLPRKLRGVRRVPGAHAARVQRTARPPERPQLLRQVLHEPPVRVVHLRNCSNDHGKQTRPYVRSIRYVLPILSSLFDRFLPHFPSISCTYHIV